MGKKERKLNSNEPDEQCARVQGEYKGFISTKQDLFSFSAKAIRKQPAALLVNSNYTTVL